MERKDFKLDVKQLGEAGEFEAVIATLNVVDSDGDVILPGAIGEQPVSILPAHDSRSVPIGKGRTFEVGDEVRVKGRFNLDTQPGREWYSALKFDMENPPARQEWSFGFFVDRYRFELRGEKEVRVLEKLLVHEVSPVVLGAGVNTRTIDVKNAGTFSERLDFIISEIKSIAEHVDHFMELRRDKKQKLTKPQQEKLDEIARRTESLVSVVNDLKQRSTARRPKFSGTEEAAWKSPTLEDYKNAYDGDTDFSNIADAPRAFRTFVADHTLLGDPDGETFREVSFFPVVNPATGKLNARALRAVLSGRGAQADVSESALASARRMAEKLLDENFRSPEERALTDLAVAFVKGGDYA